jgi:hypothetical protein
VDQAAGRLRIAAEPGQRRLRLRSWYSVRRRGKIARSISWHTHALPPSGSEPASSAGGDNCVWHVSSRLWRDNPLLPSFGTSWNLSRVERG